MKPQNEFEKNVVSASANLPSLTDRQLQWGLDNSIQYVARYNKQQPYDTNTIRTTNQT